MDDIQLFNADVLRSPHALNKRLREQPVYFAKGLGFHVVARYNLVREVLLDPKTYSSRITDFFQKPLTMRFEAASPETQEKITHIREQLVHEPETMITLDRPEHAMYRSVVDKLFTVSRIKSAEGATQKVIDKILDAAGGERQSSESHPVEFISKIAFPIPMTVIRERMGVPDADRELFERGAKIAGDTLHMRMYDDEELVNRGQIDLDLQRMLLRILDERHREPRDDMISILANARLEAEDRPLTRGEAVSILRQFLVAGQETAASALGWGMLALCEHPELQDELYANPDRISAFCEEILRYESPVQLLPRIVTADTELGGYPLKAGDVVMVRYGGANRDERTFEAPDEIVMDRAKIGMHMAFSAGIHYCIGAPLARQEMNLGFASIIKRMKNFTLDPDKPEPEAEPSFVMRCLRHLHMRFEWR